MVFSENATSFGGMTVNDYDPDSPLSRSALISIPRVRVDYDAETSAGRSIAAIVGGLQRPSG